MLVPNQKIKMAWNNKNKKWYEEKGYKFTKMRGSFYVDAEDLPPTSHKKIDCVCDLCGVSYNTEYKNYCQNVGRNNGEFHCYKCKSDNFVDIKSVNHSTDKNKKPIDEVIRIVESKNNNKLLNPEDYINVKTRNLKILCGSCGKIFITSLASIINSDGACSECGKKKGASGKNKLTSDEVEQRVNSINGNTLLNKEEYKSYGTSNLQIRCGGCGDIFVTSLANYEFNDKIRCGNCTQRISKLERIVMDYLDYENINYVYNKMFDDCKDKRCLPFDFYLPDYNLIIETDGQGHFEPVFGNDSFVKTKLHDAMKDNYCRWNNIDLLRISYLNGSKIEEIISERLGIEFNGLPYKKHNRQVFGDHYKK